MTCNCSNCPYFHRATAITTAGVLTVTNPNNIGNFDRFCLCLAVNPNNVITTAPVALTMTLNGASVPVVDEWGYPVTTDRVKTRKVYRGRYIVLTDGPHVTLLNVQCVPTETTVTTSTSTVSDTTEG